MKRRANLSLVIVAMLGILALCGAAWAVEVNEPIAHWKFDETSGTTALDCVGDNNGTVHGATWTTGQIDGALSFDGVDDYVDCGNDESLDITDEITVSAWVYSDDFHQHGMVVVKNPVNSVWEFFFEASPTGEGQSGLKWRGDSLIGIVANKPSDSQWHHILATQDGTLAKIYIDGIESASGTISALGSSSGTVNIGRFDSGVPTSWIYYFNGKIDDVRIYDKALSAEEIRRLYLEGLSDYERAIICVENAIDKKQAVLETVDAALVEEGEAYDALEELLESEDSGDLKKGDIVKSKQKVHSAMQHEEQSIDALEKSIEKLYDALTALGWEPNLVSHWKFDEGSGTIAYDCVGNNDGTIYGAIWTTGQIDDALSFDGNGDYIDCGNNASISDVSVFSVSLWFKTNGIPDPWPAPWSYPHMISHRDLSQVFWAFYLHGDWSAKLTGSIFTTGSPAHSVLNFVPDVGTWYHAVMTYDDHGDRKVRVYVDGEELSYALHTSATGTMLSNPSVNIAIGNRIGGGRDWDGSIDDVRIYNRALSAEEIQELYQDGLSGSGKGKGK